MKLITAKLFTATLKNGLVISIEQYLNTSGTFGYRMWRSDGKVRANRNFTDGTDAMKFYDLQIQLFKDEMKKGKKSRIKSWKEVK